MVSFVLVWFGLDRAGMSWFGWVRLRQIRINSVRLALVQFCLVWLDQVRLGQNQLGLVLARGWFSSCTLVRIGFVRLGLDRLGQVLQSQVRNGQVRFYSVLTLFDLVWFISLNEKIAVKALAGKKNNKKPSINPSGKDLAGNRPSGEKHQGKKTTGK